MLACRRPVEGTTDSSLAVLSILACPLLRRLAAQATYTLKATPKTVAWGYYDAKAAPVLRIKSGDTVQIRDADYE